MRRINKIFIAMFVSIAIIPIYLSADITMLALDTSGSMKTHGFEEAKAAILKTLEDIEGPVLIVGFDVNDYEIWRGTISDNNRHSSIKSISQKLNLLSPSGQYTHIEEAIDCGKVFLLSTEGNGPRKLIIFSDGINQRGRDVDRYHKPVNLSQVAESIVPQSLGFSVYFIGLSSDLETFFNAKEDSSGFIANTQYPHVKGVPLKDYNPSSVEYAFTKAVDDTTVQVVSVPIDSAQSKEYVSSSSWKIAIMIFLIFLISLIILTAIKHRKRRRTRTDTDKEDEKSIGEKPDEIYTEPLQLVIQTSGLTPISYPLMEGTLYELGVDIPVPSADQSIAVIKMDKSHITIETFSSGFSKNGTPFNGHVSLVIGDMIRYEKTTISISTSSEENEALVPSTIVSTEKEENNEIDLSDDDLNLF